MVSPPQGYFRDVTQEDVAALLPTFANPLEDPILCTPPIGRHYSSHNEFEIATFPPSAVQRSSRPLAHVPLLKDRVSELKAQAAAEVCAQPAHLHESMYVKACSCCMLQPWATAQHSFQKLTDCGRRDLNRVASLPAGSAFEGP